MNKSNFELQKERILYSIQRYKTTHGIEIDIDSIIENHNSIDVIVSHDSQKITISVSLDDISRNETHIDQIVNDRLKTLYQPRPPRAPSHGK